MHDFRSIRERYSSGNHPSLDDAVRSQSVPQGTICLSFPLDLKPSSWINVSTSINISQEGLLRSPICWTNWREFSRRISDARHQNASAHRMPLLMGSLSCKYLHTHTPLLCLDATNYCLQVACRGNRRCLAQSSPNEAACSRR
jgi:hypothetical protein